MTETLQDQPDGLDERQLPLRSRISLTALRNALLYERPSALKSAPAVLDVITKLMDES